MKEFEITLTQKLTGYYKGKIVIQAENNKKANELLDKLSNEELDEMAEWEHGDEYDGDINTITIDTIQEL